MMMPLEQLILFWTNQYLSTSDSIPEDPVESLALLDAIMEEAFGSVTEPEVALRVWAQQDELARSCVEQVDAARHEFVLNIFRQTRIPYRLIKITADTALKVSGFGTNPVCGKSCVQSTLCRAFISGYASVMPRFITNTSHF